MCRNATYLLPRPSGGLHCRLLLLLPPPSCNSSLLPSHLCRFGENAPDFPLAQPQRGGRQQQQEPPWQPHMRSLVLCPTALNGEWKGHPTGFPSSSGGPVASPCSAGSIQQCHGAHHSSSYFIMRTETQQTTEAKDSKDSCRMPT